jgi:2-phosphoglycerate kinase
MIYLIGGSPRGGKTILSKKLSEHLGTPYLSTDHLRVFLMEFYSEKEKYNKFPFEKMFDWSNIDVFFKEYSGKSLLQADLKESATMWPGIEALINNVLQNKGDYILEGVHLLPEYMEKYKDNGNVKVITLIKTDAEKIFEGMRSNRGSGDWISDNVKDDEVLRSAAVGLAEYGKYFAAESQKFDLKSINTENDFHSRIDDALTYLLKS